MRPPVLLTAAALGALALHTPALVRTSAFDLQHVPCLYWPQGIDTRAKLEAAGVKRICVAPEQAEAWRAAGFSASPISAAELASRELLPAPGIIARAGLASPTRSPWIVASGWRFTRHPQAKYRYELPAGKAAVAAAEAFAYGADAVLKIDPADVPALGTMLAFLDGLPAADLPGVADFAVVDDGSGITGEVMNLLARHNLLFEAVSAPSATYRINVAVGSRDYPAEDAADPSAFALKIRRQLTDAQRSLRVFGTDIVLCRLAGDGTRARVHLINYAGRDVEGLRIRLRGTYRDGQASVAGAGPMKLQDYVVEDGATEFSLPRLTTYGVVDLARVQGVNP